MRGHELVPIIHSIPDRLNAAPENRTPDDPHSRLLHHTPRQRTSEAERKPTCLIYFSTAGLVCIS